MPTFDLRGIRVAKYNNNAGVITYDAPISAGDAMEVQLNLAYAEGRLYAESKLAEYKKLITGGTASIAVKYIPQTAQILMFGSAEKSRTVGEESVAGIKVTAKDIAKYVGIGFYAPDVVDGVDKVTACFAYKVLFGQPGMVYQTKNDSITFQTPTTTGEFMPDDSTDQNVIEFATLESETEAIAWLDALFGVS